jgi:hypothetical protein
MKAVTFKMCGKNKDKNDGMNENVVIDRHRKKIEERECKKN